MDRRRFDPIEGHRRLPAPDAIHRAAELLRDSRRPLVIGGRGVLGARAVLERFLGDFGCLYLDTRESRGVLAQANPFSIPAVRARAMAEADLVLTLGRRLDFELAFGSAAVFSESARFIRIGRTAEELCENRRGDVEICADVDASLAALLHGDVRPARLDIGWRDNLIQENLDKSQAMGERLAAPVPAADGRIHPLILIGALNAFSDENTVCIVDGGDILSFARVALRAHTYLDLGPFGCLGSRAPYAVAAALAFPDRRTIALIGDGAFGFSATELETAVRCGARCS